MKWRNFYPDNHCFFITSTVNGRVPILRDSPISDIFFKNLTKARGIFKFKLFAYVVMPDHWHLLLHFERGADCLAFNRDFKRFSSAEIIKYLKQRNDEELLDVFCRYSNGKTGYSFWKEQARVIPIYSKGKFEKKLDYIHMNPVKRGLVSNAEDYLLSSAGFYILGEKGVVDIDELVAV